MEGRNQDQGCADGRRPARWMDGRRLRPRLRLGRPGRLGRTVGGLSFALVSSVGRSVGRSIGGGLGSASVNSVGRPAASAPPRSAQSAAVSARLGPDVVPQKFTKSGPQKSTKSYPPEMSKIATCLKPAFLASVARRSHTLPTLDMSKTPRQRRFVEPKHERILTTKM